MTQPNPQLLADRNRRTFCPRCESTVIREPAAGIPGFNVLRCTCAGFDCDWSARVEVDTTTGKARIGKPHIVKVKACRYGDAIEREPNRSRCRMHGCRTTAHEGGLCLSHRALWRHDGSPKLDAWLARFGSAKPPTRRPVMKRPAPPEPTPEPPAPKQEIPAVKTPPPEECTIDGCHRAHKSRGMCKSHLAIWRNEGKPTPADFIAAHANVPIPRKKPGPRAGVCAVPDCDRKRFCFGLCKAHHTRWVTGGQPDVDVFAVDQVGKPIISDPKLRHLAGKDAATVEAKASQGQASPAPVNPGDKVAYQGYEAAAIAPAEAMAPPPTTRTTPADAPTFEWTFKDKPTPTFFSKRDTPAEQAEWLRYMADSIERWQHSDTPACPSGGALRDIADTLESLLPVPPSNRVAEDPSDYRPRHTPGELVDLGEPMSAILVGTIGRYLTISDRDGRVIWQTLQGVAK